MNVSRLSAISRYTDILQINRLFSSSVIGSPPEGIGFGNNNHKIADVYRKNNIAVGNDVHSVLKNTIQKNNLIPLDKTIEATSEGLSSIEITIQNLVFNTSENDAKKNLEIEIQSIRKKFNSFLNILSTLQKQNNQDKD